MKYAKRLERIKLASFIKSIEVEEWKELYRGEKLLVHGDRKRFYRINIKYEKEELMEKEFDIGYKEINEKVAKVLIPQLLNYINRVKKRNELKAEIKRVTNT